MEVNRMPWSPTQYFPHPLAALDGDDFDPKLANYMSYTVMELLAWEGYGIPHTWTAEG
jgi:sterol 3beta-glucosyltransferase